MTAKGCKRGEVKMDIVGKVYGSLLVLPEHESVDVKGGTKILFKCRCTVCGSERFYLRDAIIKRRHAWCAECRPAGIRHSKLYHVYHGIKQRCYNPNAPCFDIYGGKGVRMCDEWLESYDNFQRWAMDHGYREGLTIDRLDSDGDYCPENCEWVTPSVNTARSNYGRQQVFTKLQDVYVILPDGTKQEITNITKFARDHDLNVSSVHAALHGRIAPEYHGYIFHSNQSR